MTTQCVTCEERPAEKGRRKCWKCRRSPEGMAKWKETNTRLRRIKQKAKLKPWVAHKKDTCEECGFVPVHSCQLDVDHVDGNKQNNDPSNLRTLCANCHRLKTWVCKDWQSKV